MKSFDEYYDEAVAEATAVAGRNARVGEPHPGPTYWAALRVCMIDAMTAAVAEALAAPKKEVADLTQAKPADEKPKAAAKS
jgi:hypothetical protein